MECLGLSSACDREEERTQLTHLERSERYSTASISWSRASQEMSRVASFDLVCLALPHRFSSVLVEPFLGIPFGLPLPFESSSRLAVFLGVVRDSLDH